MDNRINWSRGFFRVWAVGSLLWVAIIFALLWSSVSNPYVAPHVFIGPDGTVAWSEYSDQARAARELKARGVYVEYKVNEAPSITYLGPDDEKVLDTVKQKAPLMVGFYKAQRSSKRSAVALQAAALAFIPPTILLVVGFASAWALRGFRGDRDMNATCF